MPFRINPIMAGLIVALPNLVLAVEHGQITINDPSGATTIVLDPGDTVTHAGTGAAIDVSIAGNRLSADQAVITAGDAANGQTIGLRVSAGGAATLTGSTVSTVGAGQGAHALSATGAGSSIDARGTSVSTKGNYSHGVQAASGAQVSLQGGNIETAGTGAHGIDASGAGTLVKADGTTISTQSTSWFSTGVQVEQGARVELTDSKILTQGGGKGIEIFNANSVVALKNTDVSTDQGTGITVGGGTLTMTGGSISSQGDAVYLGSNGNANATIRDASLRTEAAIGININARIRPPPWTTSSYVHGPNQHRHLDALNRQQADSQPAHTGFRTHRHRQSRRQCHPDRQRHHHAGHQRPRALPVDRIRQRRHHRGKQHRDPDPRQRRRGRPGLRGANIVLNDSTIDTSGTTAHGLFASGGGSGIRTGAPSSGPRATTPTAWP